MRRLFWVAVGATGAVVVARKAERAARRYTPSGVAERVEEAGERATAAVGGAFERFHVARAERELELLTTLLVAPEGGDPAAVRRRRPADREPWDGAGPEPTGATARPTGRVDEDEPLYDF